MCSVCKKSRRPKQSALWLVNNAAATEPAQYFLVFEAHQCCQPCARAAQPAGRTQHHTGREYGETSAHAAPSGVTVGGDGTEVTDGGDPLKRRRVDRGSGHAGEQLLPAADAGPSAPRANGTQSAVHLGSMMDELTPADAEAAKAMFNRLADRLRPVPPLEQDAGSAAQKVHAAAVTARNELLAKLKAASGKIHGDRYELWFTLVRPHARPPRATPILRLCRTMCHRMKKRSPLLRGMRLQILL